MLGQLEKNAKIISLICLAENTQMNKSLNEKSENAMKTKILI